MHQQFQKDKENLPAILDQTKAAVLDFIATLDTRPAGLFYKEEHNSPLPQKGIGAAKTIQAFFEEYGEGLSGSAGSRYLGFVTGGSTPAAMIGDWITSAIDQNVASAGDSSANQVDYLTVNWLKELFGLTYKFAGTFVTGATMSSFVGLSIGRQWLGEQLGVNISEEGLYKIPPIQVLSAAPHSSIFKVLSMLGVGRNSVVKIPMLPNREAVNIEALEKAIQALNGQPFIVVGNAGTVNTVDFDDFEAIGKLKEKYNFWLHIDAAFGGFAGCSPLYDHFMKGVNCADSITVDLHKFLNVPYDAAVQFIRKDYRDRQQTIFKNSGAKYLEVTSAHTPFVHLTPESSRRFRALPAWFSLAAYGKEGIQEMVERNVHLAKSLGEWIKESKDFQLLAEVHFNVTCFTINDPTEPKIVAFLKRLTEDGRMFLTQSNLKGIPCIRAAFSNWQTTEKDLEIMKAALTKNIG